MNNNRVFHRILTAIIFFIFNSYMAHCDFAPSIGAELSLETESGELFHLDGINLPFTFSDSMVLYDAKGLSRHKPQNLQLCIRDGLARECKRIPESVEPDMLFLAARWDAGTWLEKHVKPGTRVRIVPSPPFLPFKIEIPVDQFNSKITSDGLLAVFTHDFGPKTPFSIYRQQAVVEKGRVIDNGSANQSIPKDGFVLSGHGTGLKPAGASRVLRWCGVGCKVELDAERKVAVITTDRETWFLRAEKAVLEASGYLAANRSELKVTNRGLAERAVAKAKDSISCAKKLVEMKEDAAAWEEIKNSLNESRQALIYAAPPVPQDVIRGIAVANPEAASERQLLLASTAGFNRVYLHYNGNVFDKTYQKAFLRTVESARRKNMEIYLWIWLPTRLPLPDEVLDRLGRDVDGKGKALNAADPVNPQTAQVVAEELQRICQLYRADGIFFDYEKYRGGCSAASVKGFCQKYGIENFDPSKPGKLADKWDNWIGGFLQKNLKLYTQTARKAGAKAELCIFPGVYAGSKGDKNKPTFREPGPAIWLPWLKAGWFDAVAPMFYAEDIDWLNSRLATFSASVRRANPEVGMNIWLIYWPEVCGWSYPVSLASLQKQLDASLKISPQGISMFSISNLDADNNPDFSKFHAAARSRFALNKIKTENE